MHSNLIEQISHKLSNKLPGKEAQLLMSPSNRKTSNNTYAKDSVRDSSVLILLYSKNGKIHIPFTLRQKYNGAHSGQVSLPGGKTEPTDLSFEHTALRETYEEIGIPMDQITVIGALTPTYIPKSNFIVYPFIAYCSVQPTFIPDSIEVAKIIEAPLEKLLDPDTIEIFERDINGYHITAPYFNIDNEKIWGATAMIISELKQLLLR